MPVPLTHVEATLLVPVGDAFLGVLAEVRMSRASRDLRPRRRVVEHDFHFLRGLGKLGVDGGRERIHPLGPAWIVYPQRARALRTELALRRREGCALGALFLHPGAIRRD